MFYFAVQVSTGYETKFKEKLIFRLTTLYQIKVHIPVQIKPIRKQGKVTNTEQIMFPGYVFLEYSEKDLPVSLLNSIQKVPYFVRILPQTSEPVSLGEKDTKLLQYLIQPKNQQISNVYFDENDRIVVVDGLLKAFEGYIIKIDKRKRRAKVQLDMCNTPYTIEVAFDEIKKKEHA